MSGKEFFNECLSCLFYIVDTKISRRDFVT
jgi:hypothetical protein